MLDNFFAHCLELPYWHYQLVLSWYPRQPESHQLSLHKGGMTDRQTDIWTQRSDQGYLGPIKINQNKNETKAFCQIEIMSSICPFVLCIT